MTPMLKAYRDAKAVYPEALLLYRMGDFYELFFDDARIAARVLNLTLTSRDKGNDAIPMAGFPHHQLETYMRRLLVAGLRVAICEQVEDAEQVAGPVSRIVTPGSLLDEEEKRCD